MVFILHFVITKVAILLNIMSTRKVTLELTLEQEETIKALFVHTGWDDKEVELTLDSNIKKGLYIIILVTKHISVYFRERSGSVVECLTRDRGAEPHCRHCVVSLSKNINHGLVLV